MIRTLRGGCGIAADPADTIPRFWDSSGRPAMIWFWKRKPPGPADATETGDPPRSEASGAATDGAPADAIGIGAGPIACSPPAETPATAAPAPAAEPSSIDDAEALPRWRERLRGNALGRGLAALFSGNPRLDEALLDELETVLLTADVGVAATTALVEDFRRRIAAREFADAAALTCALRREMVRMLAPLARPLDFTSPHGGPFVLMVVGVNGVGKTTTIGKLAQHLRREGARVMLAAGDTFRAAAVEQLRVWGERNDVPVLAQGGGADSASVIFDAVSAARARGIDVLIADTAGRLHTQAGLMDELAKIRRVIAKVDPTAPHEVLQVIDGTTGQNAISQVRQFREVAGVTGLVVTKLDGSAKGGVLFALAREFGLPVRFVGIGESLEDLRPFDPAAFVEGLLPERLGTSGA
jgi:fused signal recognition particle receptor